MHNTTSTISHRGMKRMRNSLGALVVVASLSRLPGAAAMATAKPSTTRLKAASATANYQDTSPATSTSSSSSKKTRNPWSYYDSRDDFDLDEDYDYDDFFGVEDLLSGGGMHLQEQMDSVKKLQRSTGSEILNDELQRQIDSASASPDMFLDAHIGDATLMEKVAMSSIPQQLPRPALAALLTKTKQRTTNAATTTRLNSGATRVTHEQELELGRMIQRGANLHKLKAEFEDRQGREILRQEWTDLAGLDSPKELRRQVSAYRQAKQLLVSANMGLVHVVVKSQYTTIRRATGLSRDELIQEGSLGLLRAAELFDPSRGLRFSTYATIWIKGTLQNSHVTDGTITLPQREKTKWNKIVKAHEELTKMNNNEPTVEEIAHHLNMKVADVVSTKRKMTQTQQVMSLDYEYAAQTRSGTDGGTVRSLENDKAFREDADLAERTQLRADVIAAMAKNLDAREARLMRLRYGLADGQTRSISECAEAMGLSQTRVQQLAQQCLKKLREAAEAESLEEYFLTMA